MSGLSNHKTTNDIFSQGAEFDIKKHNATEIKELNGLVIPILNILS